MRYFLEISFNGTSYHGWQIQPDMISIQEVITESLHKILSDEIEIVGAGRTDAGVHAEQMFAHFDVNTVLPDDIEYRLNSILPNDIVIHRCFAVDDQLHARFDAVRRTYEYRIFLGRNPFMIDTTWQLHRQQLDVETMNQAAQGLLEYQDFESFSKVKTDVKTFNCQIFNAVWRLENQHLIFHISADRFLRNMVRAIVGTLIEVGRGKITVEDFNRIIESKKRSKAGASVPAKGLFLTEVKYNF